jgi:Domain of Unknown Function (DUF928)
MLSTKFVRVLVGATALTLLQSVGLLDAINTNTSIDSSLSIGLSSKALANNPFAGYRPPTQRKPIQRTDGAGSRGCPQGSFGSLSLLTPNDHIGLTVSERPTFSWYVSAVSSTPMKFALVEPGVSKPVYVKKLKVEKPGIVQLQLPRNQPKLVVGKDYRWTVSLVCNPNRPSLSIYVRSWITRTQIEAVKNSALASSSVEGGVFYAQQGIWYDAIAAISQAYLKNPKNPITTKYLGLMLEQVGLSGVVTQLEQVARG